MKTARITSPGFCDALQAILTNRSNSASSGRNRGGNERFGPGACIP